MVVKNLVRSLEAKTLAGTVVKTVVDELNITVGEGGKISFFREVLTDEAVGIFVSASLPGGIGIGKEEVGVETVGDCLVTTELKAVVRGDGKFLVL